MIFFSSWQTNEPKDICFCISNIQGSDNVPKGIIKDRNIVYYNIGTDQYQLKSASIVGDQIDGNNMILIDSSTGKSMDVKSNAPSYDGGSYNTKEYHGHNPYIKEQYIQSKNEESNQVVITCMNGDMGFLTPNKHYTFLTDVTNIANHFRGDYRLSGFKSTFSKNGDYFDSTSVITVKKASQ